MNKYELGKLDFEDIDRALRMLSYWYRSCDDSTKAHAIDDLRDQFVRGHTAWIEMEE